MSYFTKSQIEKIVSFAFEAGKIAAQAFNSRDFKVVRKTDNSQVTSADVAVSKFLAEKLAQEFPQIPIICEEGNLREVAGDVFFLIDPIDGTSSFVSHNVEFAINIALVEKQKAVFGLIYAPLFEDGKMIFSDHEDKIICKTHGTKEKILQDVVPQKSKLRIITSSRSKDIDVETCIAQLYPEFIENFVVEKLSSAIKFFRIVEGDADLYLHFRKSMEWDTASGQALIELMGGKVKKLFFNQAETSVGEKVIYKKTDFANQPFIAFIQEK